MDLDFDHAQFLGQIKRPIAPHQGRFLLSRADVLVAPLLERLEALPNVERVEVAGSYRRRRETVGDVDLLVLCDDEESREQSGSDSHRINH